VLAYRKAILGVFSGLICRYACCPIGMHTQRGGGRGRAPQAGRVHGCRCLWAGHLRWRAAQLRRRRCGSPECRCCPCICASLRLALRRSLT
jgi:hypothetical protein